MKNIKANELQTDLDVYGNSPHIYYTPNVQHHFTVAFTRDIEQPEFYDSVIHLLLTAEEGTTIDFLISSYGGHLDSLLSLRGALQATRADVTGYLMSQAASAAGMLLLCCHNFVINEFATFHAHTVSYGSYGKGDDVKQQVDYITKQTERIVRSIYDKILSEDEQNLLIAGKEFYFEDHEIRERLQHREQKRAEESQEQATEFLKEIEDTQFDYSELPLQELEEELQMYNEDIKKLKRAIADKKKGSEAILPVEKAVIKKKPVTTKEIK